MTGIERENVSLTGKEFSGASFACDLAGTATAFPHFWEHTVGSGHATLALRADWQAQIKKCHDELGFRYVRFHGLLSDDVGTFIVNSDKPIYSFFNADQIMDYLLSIGMKPFVELSFMPTALSSADATVFHYRGNVTPPRDYEQWGGLIHKLVTHWAERYGLAELRQWFFEVWNEPNLKAFWTGTQEDYFRFYGVTAQAIKSVDRGLQVGGPATAMNAWISDFIKHCETNGLDVDFISTHHYPTDAFGKPGDDTITQLSLSKPSVLREQTRAVKSQAGNLPVYYTEWSSSSNPRDPLHDEPYAASFIVKTIMEAQGLVEGYSYWTFSDIFEENYFPSVPFHGGFGLLNIHGIAKPSYRAYQLLHSLGTKRLEVEGVHETVSAWAIADDKSTTFLFTNFALPRHTIVLAPVRMTIKGARPVLKATIRRIDTGHANAVLRWQELGKPDYLKGDTLRDIHEASQITSEPQPLEHKDGVLHFEILLPPLSVTAVTLAFALSD
ncbi:MAG: glycosyl hydrolase [Pseudomonadota bacterium]|nr:glycosyl hydrolase [Pseudomonadota bacterium]